MGSSIVPKMQYRINSRHRCDMICDIEIMNLSLPLYSTVTLDYPIRQCMEATHLCQGSHHLAKDLYTRIQSLMMAIL